MNQFDFYKVSLISDTITPLKAIDGFDRNKVVTRITRTSRYPKKIYTYPMGYFKANEKDMVNDLQAKLVVNAKGYSVRVEYFPVD